MDEVTSRLLDAWAEHVRARPSAPEEYLVNVDHLRVQMDAWQAQDSAYRLLIGVRMANSALLERMTDTKGDED